MVLVYCPNCRMIKINADDIREMTAVFDEIEKEEIQEIQELINQAESEEEAKEIREMVSLRKREKVVVSNELRGDSWISLSDQEWGVIHTILSSSSLLYLVENFADYVEKCPKCLAKEAELDKAALN